MRCCAALLCTASLFWAAETPRDLASLFAGRSGSALVWNLEEKRLEAAWNEARARSLAFRPGSTLKPFALAAYIEAGQYRVEDKVRCPEGLVNGPAALAYSCNAYFDSILAKMSPEDRERGFARFGLTAPKSSADTLPMTNIALLEVWRRLLARHREERMRPVFEGLEQATDYGTARLAAVAQTKVAGKTGTMRGTAVFAGFAPANKPKFLVLVHLDTGTGGGDAAPYAAKIFSQLFARAISNDPRMLSVRLFWQTPLKELNLAPGHYPAGTKITTGNSVLIAPGPIDIRQETGGYTITAQVALEDYVAAVLDGEAGGLRQAQARRAMAVAARTYAVHFRGRHSAEGFDFCDTTHCQDARFVAQRRRDLGEDVEATEGEMLWWNGKPAATYYHADSGGWLESAEGAPYLPSRADRWWKETPEALWRWTISAPQLAQALGLTLITPNFRVTAREPGGRARALDVFGHPAEAASFRTAIGRTLGWEKLPSRLFEVKREGAQLIFTGKGRGHGIGLPQTSAERMAAGGSKYPEILAEYYPGTRLSVGAGGMAWQTLSGTKVQLLTTNAARDRNLLAQAEQELAVLERLTGWSANPIVRIYPSREAFRDVTGITANVAGATRGRQVKLPPNPSLGTLRHELLHAVLEANTSVRHPDWFREGLVLVLLNEPAAEGAKAARGRTEQLLKRQGKAKVLEYWKRGLPAEELRSPV